MTTTEMVRAVQVDKPMLRLAVPVHSVAAQVHEALVRTEALLREVQDAEAAADEMERHVIGGSLELAGLDADAPEATQLEHELRETIRATQRAELEDAIAQAERRVHLARREADGAVAAAREAASRALLNAAHLDRELIDLTQVAATPAATVPRTVTAHPVAAATAVATGEEEASGSVTDTRNDDPTSFDEVYAVDTDPLHAEGAHQIFWAAEVPAPIARTATALIEVLLPTLALLVVLVLVLALIG